MKRTIIKIDEETCNGCGNCVEGCHEGALKLIDGKAVMISEIYCDGLGACIGECPVEAITLEEVEALPYSEVAVMERLLTKGEAVIVAHLNHLKECGEKELVKQGMAYLEEKGIQVAFDCEHAVQENEYDKPHASSGCPGAVMREVKTTTPFISPAFTMQAAPTTTRVSELRQFPVQLHLINPQSNLFKRSNLLLASDCSAFASGEFHSRFLKGKSLAIACPKLDMNQEVYVNKLTTLMDEAEIETLTVLMMEVPCCGGLLRLAEKARSQAKRFVPIKSVYLAVSGNLLHEQWG
ncbi:MAG: 4Fe-4S dicluster protein [Bacteroidetes bacterium]|jgi:NAD-dependent dihydropyrimidine dehydrogenase PreA subunit|nr:4Fe-4S dicluster protein [Bacteroidota bacterium]